MAVRTIVLVIAGRVGVGREASSVPSLILVLLGRQRQLIGIEWTRVWLDLDRRPGVSRRTVQLREGYWPFIDGHALTSRTVAG